MFYTANVSFVAKWDQQISFSSNLAVQWQTTWWRDQNDLSSETFRHYISAGTSWPCVAITAAFLENDLNLKATLKTDGLTGDDFDSGYRGFFNYNSWSLQLNEGFGFKHCTGQASSVLLLACSSHLSFCFSSNAAPLGNHQAIKSPAPFWLHVSPVSSKREENTKTTGDKVFVSFALCSVWKLTALILNMF